MINYYQTIFCHQGNSSQMFQVFSFFILIDFYLQCFSLRFILVLKSFSINLLNSGLVVIKHMVFRYFIFNLCDFCIESSFCSKTSNVRYFILNFCSFCVLGSLCCQNINIRYLVFNLYGFCNESNCRN